MLNNILAVLGAVTITAVVIAVLLLIPVLWFLLGIVVVLGFTFYAVKDYLKHKEDY